MIDPTNLKPNTSRKTSLKTWLVIIGMLVVFCIIQASTLDYGTKINDLPHIRDYAAGSVQTEPGQENLNKWMKRYKLYSIEADEMMNIRALSQIKPKKMMFDPGFYQYGGAWLYPLGVWYYGLSKAGILPLTNMKNLLEEPDRIDAIYFWGRAFVLVFISLSALLLFAALIRICPPTTAILLVAIYLTVPSTIMYSQIMKPHFYGLVWANAAFYLMVRTMTEKQWSFKIELLLGILLGLAVGTSFSFGLFSVYVGCILLALALKGLISWRSILNVPLVAALVLSATNPYLFFNKTQSQGEISALSGWFDLGFSPESLGTFIKNSLLSGFGIGLTAFTVLAGAWVVFSHRSRVALFIIFAILLTLLVISTVTSGHMSHWHTNLRYGVYLLPGFIFLIALSPAARYTPALVLVLVLTIIQATPMKLAYIDENDPIRSTRFQSMTWIHENIETGSVLCFGSQTPAPFDTPPIDFSRFKISELGCQYRVAVERERRDAKPTSSWSLVKRFSPRYSFEAFPLVFEHINPQISVYRRNG